MPLNGANMVLNGHLASADIRGFYDLLTGAMTDQPVNFGNNLSIVGVTMLSRDPTLPLEAATKQYVDTHGVSWPLLAPHSTVSTPNYAFAPDPTTGMYSPGNGLINLAAEGADVLRLATTSVVILPPLGVQSTLDVQGLTNFYAGINARNGVAVLGGAATGNGTVPPGGLAAQVLTKNTNADYDLVWGVGGGGGGTSILVYSAPAVTGTTVTLPQIPSTNGVFEVSVNGQALMPTRDWTISGNVITFATALSADDVLVQYQVAPFNPTQVSSHFEITLAPGTTSFTLPAVPSGVPLLTRGGVVQYTTQGHYVMAGATVNLGVAVNTTEDGHFSVDYITGGGTDAATVGGLSPAQLLAKTNLLTNGGFEIWQRGNGPFTANSAYTADRWAIYAQVGTTSIARDTANTDTGSLACAAVTTTAPQAGNGNGPYQIIDCGGDFPQLRGRTLTCSVRVKCSQAGSVRLELVGDKGASMPHTYVSAYHSGGGAYETLTATIPLPAAATGMTIWITGVVAGTWYLDNAMLVVGPVAADYSPLHPEEDLARCQRYFEEINMLFLGNMWSGTSGVNYGYPYYYKVTKAVTPTITVPALANWTNSGISAIFVDSIGQLACRIAMTSNVVGNIQAGLNSVSPGLRMEANP